MFTVKVCNPGMTTYFETDAVSKESLKSGREVIRFSAQGEERRMVVRSHPDDPDDIYGIPVVERIYLMNDHGKTVDIFR